MYVCTLQRVLLFDQHALLFSSYSPPCAYYYVIQKNVRFSNIVTLTRLQIFVSQNHLIDRLHHLLSGRLHLHLDAMGLTFEGLLIHFRSHFFLVFEFSKILFCWLLSSVGHAIPSICLKYTPTCFLGLSKEQWLVIKLMCLFRNKFWPQLFVGLLVY